MFEQNLNCKKKKKKKKKKEWEVAEQMDKDPSNEPHVQMEAVECSQSSKKVCVINDQLASTLTMKSNSKVDDTAVIEEKAAMPLDLELQLDMDMGMDLDLTCGDTTLAMKSSGQDTLEEKKRGDAVTETKQVKQTPMWEQGGQKKGDINFAPTETVVASAKNSASTLHKNFIIEKSLGVGAFGKVVEATNIVDRSRYAMKIIPFSLHQQNPHFLNGIQ
ncbi:hypothetical protein RFI_17616, partial [Reticulomyxa filosa]